MLIPRCDLEIYNAKGEIIVLQQGITIEKLNNWLGEWVGCKRVFWVAGSSEMTLLPGKVGEIKIGLPPGQ